MTRNSRFSSHIKNIDFVKLTRWCELLPTIQSTPFRVQLVYKGMQSVEDSFRVTVLQPSWHSQKKVLNRGWEVWLLISFSSFNVISINSQKEVSNLPSIQQKVAIKGLLYTERYAFLVVVVGWWVFCLLVSCVFFFYCYCNLEIYIYDCKNHLLNLCPKSTFVSLVIIVSKLYTQNNCLRGSPPPTDQVILNSFN